MSGMMKHKSPRKMSQASIRSFKKPKPATTPDTENIFHEPERFISGKKYYIADSPYHAENDNINKIFVYQCKQGKHYMFRNAAGGWLTTRTDVQLIGKQIKEVQS